MANQKRHLLSYLMGLFDGEGCISIGGLNKVKGHYQVTVCVRMVNEYLPRLFQASYGGRVLPDPRTGNQRDEWRWRITGQKAKPFLEDTLKYSILKKGQAEVALHLLDLQYIHHSGKPVSSEEQVLREADSILMHQLNKRGKA